MPSYFHRQAVLSWLSSSSAASRCLSACSFFPACEWFYWIWRWMDFLWELLLLLPESPFLKVSQSHGQKGCSTGEAIFYIPTTVLHASYFGKPWIVDSFAALDTVQAIAWWIPTPLTLYGFLRSSCSHLTTVVVFLCHHRMLLHPDSFALAKHCVCSKSGGFWDRGNLLFLPQPLRGFSPLLRG